jgi:hypothetical protein
MQTTPQPEQRPDLSLAEACMLCGGSLQLRASPGQIWTYCTSCHWLAKSRLGLNTEGIQIEFQPLVA